MSKVVAALGRLETREGCADRGPQDLARATARLPEDRFQLRKRVLDRIQVRTVFRQKPETGPAVLNRPADRRTLVTRQIVHDDDVAGGQRRDEDLLDVGEEARAVDRTIEDGGRGKARHAERGEKRRRMPPPIGRVVGDARAVESTPIAAYEIRAPLSSRNTSRVGSSAGAAACQAVRASAMSARSCSDARTVFFKSEPEPLHGAADRGQTGRRGQCLLQFRQRAIGLLADERLELR